MNGENIYGEPLDRGRLKNRTEQISHHHIFEQMVQTQFQATISNICNFIRYYIRFICYRLHKLAM